jgi:hypothetical protein
MNPLTIYAVAAGPLEPTNRLQSIRDALNAGPRTDEILMVLAGTVLLIAVIAICARYTDPQNRPKAQRRVDIFKQAVALLGLNDRERADVRAVAKHTALSSPASVLLSPTNLAAAAERALRRTPNPELRRRLDRLSLRLFGVPLPTMGDAQAEEC